MSAQPVVPSRWSTPSLGRPESIADSELSVLRAHYENCKGCQGRWFAICCALEAVHAFVAPRFLTTVVMVAGLSTVIAAAAAAL